LSSETETLLSNVDRLKNEYKHLSENPAIRIASKSLRCFEFGIHARSGDTARMPLLYGGQENRYFPYSGYKLIIESILSQNHNASVFIASDCGDLYHLKAKYPHNIWTETDLFHSLPCSFQPNTLAGNWMTIKQLSVCSHLISPTHSAFSFLARIISSDEIKYTSPAEFLGTKEIMDDIHNDCTSQAKSLFLCPRLSHSDAWTHLLLWGWISVPFRTRLEIAFKLLKPW